MKTFNEFKPKVEEHSHFFKLPSLISNLKSYIFLLMLAILFLGLAFYIPSQNIKNIEKTFSILSEEVNNNIQERDRLGNEISVMLKDIGYDEKDINTFLNELNYRKMVNVISLEQANKEFEQAKIDFHNASEILKNSQYNFFTSLEDIPTNTPAGQEFLKAINTPQPPNLRTSFLIEKLKTDSLESYKTSVAERKKAVEVFERVKEVFNKEKEKQAKLKAKQLDQEIKKESASKKRTQDKVMKDLLKNPPIQKKTEEKKQPTVTKQPKEIPQSNIPTW